MKKLDTYIIGSIVRILFVTIFLVMFVLLLFDIFSQLDQYLARETPYRTIFTLTLLYAPQACVLAMAPSSLFATTYVLSLLQANNEIIILYNSGISFRRVLVPILCLGVALTCMQFTIQEVFAIPLMREKHLQTQNIFGIRSVTDNRNVTLQHPQGEYVIHAGRYIDNQIRISQVVVYITDNQKRISAKIEAPSGYYNGSYWVLERATLFLVDAEGLQLSTLYEEEYHNKRLTVEPALFRNLSADISTMELPSAISYVRRIRTMNANQYALYATELYSRIWRNLSPLILIIISCSTVFNWKKNVLILSILTSLSIAVLYYVIQLISTIFAKQGIIYPYLGEISPMIFFTCVAFISLLLRRR